MILERLIHPGSKLATTRLWHPPLAGELGVEGADEDDLYGAMDWLLERQAGIEKKLAKIARQVARRTKTPLGAAEIGRKVGQVIGRFKVAKHFEIAIAPGIAQELPRNCPGNDGGSFAFRRDRQAIAAEAGLDGIYIIRTAEGLPIHSFTTPIAELGTRCRNLRRLKTDPQAPAFEPDSEPTQIQQRAFDLVDAFPVPGTAQP